MVAEYYGLSRPTADVDIIQVRGASNAADVQRIGGKGSPLAKKWPNGFLGDSGQGLLNEVWYYTEHHPELQRNGTYRGPDALMDAISYILGIKIDY